VYFEEEQRSHAWPEAVQTVHYAAVATLVSLAELWFGLVALVLAVYVVLDGFDLGVGALHLFIARGENERRACLRSIGPVWDGNEVWLLAGGGTLYFAFPILYARSFSGFYLPLMIVLWLLTFRALAIELRHHLHDELWRPLWDVAFAVSSTLLIVFFGAALGNVVRGVSFERDGHFFAPLWTDLGVDGAKVGVIDWYTLVVAGAALIVLLQHGACWLAWKVDGPVRERARRWSLALWVASILAVGAVTLATLKVQPQVWRNLSAWPLGWILPGLAALGLGAVPLWGRKSGRGGFFASALFLLGLLGSAAFGLYPWVLPSRPAGAGLTAQAAAAPENGLLLGLYWWVPGILLAAGYSYFTYSRMPAVFSVDDSADH
jgi:cytochrome d ubiquinol oxidase subunit II